MINPFVKFFKWLKNKIFKSLELGNYSPEKRAEWIANKINHV